MPLEYFLDHITHVAVPHVRLAQDVIVDLRQGANGGADHSVAEIQLSLIAIGKGSGREIDRRQGKIGVVEAAEVRAEDARLLQLAAGATNRFRGSGKGFYGDAEAEGEAEGDGDWI
jgi:hypothetical protein